MISVILPTIRPELIEDTLKNILESKNITFEIIVVADYDCDFQLDDIIHWIKQERQGTVAAINLAHTHAIGDYYFLTNDESRLTEYTLDLLLYCSKSRIAIITPTHIPYFPFYYYGKQFAAFPFISKEILNILCNNEYILDPQLKCFYADPDLSLRAWESRIPVMTCYGAQLIHINKMDAPGHQENVHAYLDHDRDIFKERWSHLGEFKDP